MKRCPICRKAASDQQTPFCSNRCRAIDLGRWFGEDYRLAAQEPAPEEEQ